MESEEWQRLVNHPQLFIYQTGGSDAVILGGDTDYGKLHAKFIFGETGGFVGTSNFDYRSNLYNNELGFFFVGEGVRQELVDVFEYLKSTSSRWGTPEWLEMRRKVMESDSKKAGPARKQRGTFKTIRGAWPGIPDVAPGDGIISTQRREDAESAKLAMFFCRSGFSRDRTKSRLKPLLRC